MLLPFLFFSILINPIVASDCYSVAKIAMFEQSHNESRQKLN